MKDIEIKSVEVKEIAVPKKKTLYVCVYWNSNGIIFANSPSEQKEYQENYAISMSKYAEHTEIYKFEIDIPQLKQK